MQINVQRTRQYLKQFDFQLLFINELGWNNYRQKLNVEVDKTEYILTAVSEKCGMVVFECQTDTTEGGIPDSQTRRKIQREVAKSVYENFVIYTDAEKTTQIWQCARREHGKPTACPEYHYHITQDGDLLIQKLDAISVSFDEEGEITLFGVTSRVQASFYVERVTRGFYNHFKREQTAFLDFLSGIPDQELQRWYASVILNRLMFIYFIQKKGFLNKDTSYLRTKLDQSKEQGRDQYYKEFLCPLFFDGFAKQENERSNTAKRLLGTVPYLNGGIFQKHEIETRYGDSIDIPDTAFEKLFRFFEQYQWHLDDRPLQNDREINPEVLGYIFEKYINQKELGAYYTKEDITDYISKNTIIPTLFDIVKDRCRTALENGANVWKLLQDDPDRYIYESVKKGVKKDGVELELPQNIADGISDVSLRATDWNTFADSDYALPTETWREVVARQRHYKTVRSKLENGEIADINELITYNLDIRQFTQGVIENCEDPELIHAFWKAITEMTILDPTCGSGAFLFAALNILESLYEACLDRMQAFVNEHRYSPQDGMPEQINNFLGLLKGVDEHPNRKYFILKSIIINNLYGVDVEEEAVEICKLRLFLKMVAQIDDVNDIEPLPDIDFNVQAGNALVGYATYAEVKKGIKLDFNEAIKRIEKKAEKVEELFKRFRLQQTKSGGAVTLADKQELQDKIQVLEDELNGYLAGEYGVDQNKRSEYLNWLGSHKPFHWFTAFYRILNEGGFDVIIGNPPYVEYSKARKKYTIRGYETRSNSNLYAYVMERCTHLSSGRIGWIVPISWVSTNRMADSRKIVSQSHSVLHISNYADRPSSLFIGVHQKLSIVLGAKASPVIHTTEFYRCYSRVGEGEGENEHLFNVLAYHLLDWDGGVIQKFSSDLEASIFRKLTRKNSPITTYFSTSRMNNDRPFHLTQRLMMWVKCFLAPKKSNEYKTYYPIKEFSAEILSAVFNSSLFFWFWDTKGDCWHLTVGDMDNFHIDLSKLSDDNRESLIGLAKDLERDLEENKEYVGTRQTDYEYYHKKSKGIIDDIDRVLSQLYGLTDEEEDFIINYAIKYRMGLEDIEITSSGR